MPKWLKVFFSIFIALPYVGSGLFNNGTDISLFYVLLLCLYFLFLEPLLAFLFIPLVFVINIKACLYLIVVLLSFRLKISYHLNKVRPAVVSLIILFFIMELFYPDLHQFFFARNLIEIESRGMSIIGPEPATTAFNLFLLLILYRENLVTRIFLVIMIFFTGNVIIGFVSLLLLFNRMSLKNIVMLTTIPLFLLLIAFNTALSTFIPDRTYFMLVSIYDGSFLDFILSDVSILRRLDFLGIVFGADFLPTTEFSQEGVASGLFVGYNYFGTVWLIVFIILVSFISNIYNLLVLFFFLILGSPIMLLPYYLILSENQYVEGKVKSILNSIKTVYSWLKLNNKLTRTNLYHQNEKDF
jgi:hypothetical protein